MKHRSIFVHEDYISVFRSRPRPHWLPRCYKRTAERERRLMAVVGNVIQPGTRQSWRWAWHEE